MPFVNFLKFAIFALLLPTVLCALDANFFFAPESPKELTLEDFRSIRNYGVISEDDLLSKDPSDMAATLVLNGTLSKISILRKGLMKLQCEIETFDIGTDKHKVSLFFDCRRRLVDLLHGPKDVVPHHKELKKKLAALQKSFEAFIFQKNTESLKNDLDKAIDTLNDLVPKMVTDEADEWLDETIKNVEIYTDRVKAAGYSVEKSTNTSYRHNEWLKKIQLLADNKWLMRATLQSIGNEAITGDQIQNICELKSFFPDDTPLPQLINGKMQVPQAWEDSVISIMDHMENFGLFTDEFQVAISEARFSLYRDGWGPTQTTYLFKVNHVVLPIVGFLELFSHALKDANEAIVKGKITGVAMDNLLQGLFDRIRDLHKSFPNNVDVASASLIYLFNLPYEAKKRLLQTQFKNFIGLVADTLKASKPFLGKWESFEEVTRIFNSDINGPVISKEMFVRYIFALRKLEDHFEKTNQYKKFESPASKGLRRPTFGNVTMRRKYFFPPKGPYYIFLPELEKYVKQEQDMLNEIKATKGEKQDMALKSVLGRLNYVARAFTGEREFFKRLFDKNSNPSVLDKVEFILEQMSVPGPKNAWEKNRRSATEGVEALDLFYYRYLHYMLYDAIERAEKYIPDDIKAIESLVFELGRGKGTVNSWAEESLQQWSDVISTCQFIVNQLGTIREFPEIVRFTDEQEKMYEIASELASKLDDLAWIKRDEGWNAVLTALMAWLDFLVQRKQKYDNLTVEYIGTTKLTKLEESKT